MVGLIMSYKFRRDSNSYRYLIDGGVLSALELIQKMRKYMPNGANE